MSATRSTSDPPEDAGRSREKAPGSPLGGAGARMLGVSDRGPQGMGMDDDPDEWHQAAERASAERAGPIVLLLPLLSLAFAVLWYARDRGAAPTGVARPPARQSTASVPGWTMSWWLDAGHELELELHCLHADSGRQAFDAAALAQRYGLGAGEPFRLTARLRRIGAAADGAAPASIPIERLAALRVESDSREPLRPFAPAAIEGQRDPIRALLSLPDGELAAGQELSFVLWGPRPLGAVRLTGLDEEPIVASAIELPRERSVRSIARLDASGRGAAEERR